MQISKLPFASQTITIYNQYKIIDPIASKSFVGWIRHIIPNCYFGKSKKTVVYENAVVTHEEYHTQIPQDTNFLDYFDWAELPDKMKKAKFTVNVGDVVICGDVGEEIPPHATVNFLLEKYKNRCFTVKSVKNNTGYGILLGHYALGGK